MSDNITLTAGIRANLLSLQNTSKMIEDTQFKLSTGRKINSAIDGPSAFFAAKALTYRAEDLMARKDGIGQGISALENADKSLESISELLKNAEATLNQAKEASTQVTKVTTKDLSAQAADLVGGDFANGDQFNIAVDGGATTTISIATGDTADDLATAISATDAGISAEYTNGRIEITADAGTTFTISDATNTPVATMGLTDNLGNAISSTDDVAFGSTGSGTDISTLETNYKNLLTQIDSLVDDASYKGVNLLDGNTLNVAFNEDGSSKLDVVGVNFKHSADLAMTDEGTVDFTSGANIETYLGEVQAAVDSVQAQQATFGTNLSIVKVREDFTNNMINTLESGAGKLVNADMNEESANMLSLQTRQQMGTISLSIANQAEQSVLRLF